LSASNMAIQQDFWTFSVALYSDPEVKAACLDLQDHFGADVNLLLFCLWTDGISETLLDRAIAEAWPLQRDFIQPLRERRRLLAKTGPEAGLRGKIAEAELAAEKLEQETLAALIKSPVTSPDLNTARAQLRAYALRLNAEENDFLARAMPLLEAISRL